MDTFHVFRSGVCTLSPNAPLSTIATQICRLSRSQCIQELQTFSYVQLDFTRKALERMTTDKLRHVLLAAYSTAKKYH